MQLYFAIPGFKIYSDKLKLSYGTICQNSIVIRQNAGKSNNNEQTQMAN